MLRQPERIPNPCLAFITDRTLLPQNWTLAQAIAPAVTGGANLVIMREIDLPPNPRLTVAQFVMDGIGGRCLFMMSGDPDLAVRAGAAGILVENPPDAAAAREKLGHSGILGVLSISRDSISQAEEARADFLIVNLDWRNPAGAHEQLRAYRETTLLPLLAGVDMAPDDARQCMRDGADGIVLSRCGMVECDRTRTARAYAGAIGLAVGTSS